MLRQETITYINQPFLVEFNSMIRNEPRLESILDFVAEGAEGFGEQDNPVLFDNALYEGLRECPCCRRHSKHINLKDGGHCVMRLVLLIVLKLKEESNFVEIGISECAEQLGKAAQVAMIEGNERRILVGMMLNCEIVKDR